MVKSRLGQLVWLEQQGTSAVLAAGPPRMFALFLLWMCPQCSACSLDSLHDMFVQESAMAAQESHSCFMTPEVASPTGPSFVCRGCVSSTARIASASLCSISTRHPTCNWSWDNQIVWWQLIPGFLAKPVVGNQNFKLSKCRIDVGVFL